MEVHRNLKISSMNTIDKSKENLSNIKDAFVWF